MKILLRVSLVLLFSITMILCFDSVAFADVEQFIIPEGVKAIEEEAFANCESMVSITIPAGMRRIGKNAFLNCTNLTDVYYCGSISDWSMITIEDGNKPLVDAEVHFINIIASGNCGRNGDPVTWALDSLNRLIISGNGAMANYATANGGRLNTPWYPYRSQIEVIIVEKGVSELGKFAFYHTDANRAILPEGIETLPLSCFGNCNQLSNIKLPSTLKTLENECLWNTNFDIFTLPASVEEIYGHPLSGNFKPTVLAVEEGNQSFMEKNGFICTIDGKRIVVAPIYLNFLNAQRTYITIPEGVTTIGYQAFMFDDYYEEIHIPSSVSYIEAYCFSHNTALKDIYYYGNIQQWNSITVETGNDVFTKATVHFS